MAPTPVPITCAAPSLRPHALALAQRFNLPMASNDSCDTPGTPGSPASSDQLHLRLTDAGLSLHAGDLSMRVDFLTGTLAHRIAAGSHNAFRSENLIKALAFKPGHATQELGPNAHIPGVIDATAGLGRDAVLLALAGFHVIAIEQHPAVAALLDDGLSRALADASFAERLGGRLSLRLGDAVDLLPQLPPADAIYLDPMFPVRSKSALVKKQMQLLQMLHDVDAAEANESRLLDAALAHTTRRVIVKRPRLAPPLAGRDPTFTRPDKTMRYDIYQCSSIA